MQCEYSGNSQDCYVMLIHAKRAPWYGEARRWNEDREDETWTGTAGLQGKQIFNSEKQEKKAA